MKHTQTKKPSRLFRVIKWIVRRVYPEMEIVGWENLPDEPSVIVANHTQLHGPIACELFFPDHCYTWCAGQMMHLKEVPAYAYQDFWSQKPARSRWLYRIAAFLIAPLSVVVFNNARTIAVYRDNRSLSTFRSTVAKLKEGCHVVIFPEYDAPHDHILSEFQTRFVDIARLYGKKSGRELPFVPMYIAPNLRQMHLGQPIRFDSGNDIAAERERVCGYLMQQITDIACALPEHTVVPYRNIPKKLYPSNLPKENVTHAKTDR